MKHVPLMKEYLVVVIVTSLASFSRMKRFGIRCTICETDLIMMGFVEMTGICFCILNNSHSHFVLLTL